ncbi:PREDICTED: uncharacterized protein LOC105576178 [Cercocebus atys]|uniref:uncharacterized protein LOC105576178 n=1 Tax=Cercocebus atys TaxID=9531 RepID=UPI0005F4A531|nr:PREDICTED: uncharacterized protein LOC105576178 [Cercocebus atys]
MAAGPARRRDTPPAAGRDAGLLGVYATSAAPRRPTSLSKPRGAGLSAHFRVATDWSRRISLSASLLEVEPHGSAGLHQPAGCTHAQLFLCGLRRPPQQPSRLKGLGRKGVFKITREFPGGVLMA